MSAYVQVLGANDYSQLTSQVEERATQPKVINISPINPLSIKQVACGAYYVMILTDNNELYGCGRNDQGELGISNIPESITTFTKIPFHKNIKFIAANYFTSFIVTTDNQIYWSGNQPNTKNHILLDTFEKLRIEKHLIIEKIETSSASIHCLLETYCNKEGYSLKGFGYATAYGYKGDHSELSTINDIHIRGPFQILSAGGNHSIMLTADGRLFGGGSNTNGQVNGKAVDTYFPIQELEVPFSINLIRDIKSGEYFTLYALQTGVVYIVGGYDTKEFRILRQHIDLPFKIGCGYGFSIILDCNGYVFTDLSKSEFIKTDYRLDMTSINQIICGKSFAYFYYQKNESITKHFSRLFKCCLKESKLTDITIQL
ncbi:hypothetical protein ABK040_001160 [Willaertia magna]